jgi:hypothetical protein
MPKHLLFACLIYIASRGAMAMLAPLYETGSARLTSPILMLAFVGIVTLFMRRAQWAWRFIPGVCFAEIVINVAFFPTIKFHGAYTQMAQALVSAIVVACCVILWSVLRSARTALWFQNRRT